MNYYISSIEKRIHEQQITRLFSSLQVSKKWRQASRKSFIKKIVGTLLI